MTMEAWAKKIRGPVKSYAYNNTPSKNSSPNTAGGNLSRGVQAPKAPVRMLTKAEMAARREKGLCYNCDEKYSPNHDCKHRLYFMTMSGQEEFTYVHNIAGEETEDLNEESTMEETELSLNALHGGNVITTMRFTGMVGEQQVDILIDTGSTLSFIRESTAERLGCKTEEVSPLLIRVANGQKLISTLRVKGLTWEVQGHAFSHPLRLLKNDGCDLILGCDWMEACSPIEFDFKKKIVTFKLGRKKIRMHARLPTIGCQLIDCHSLYKLMHSPVGEGIEEMYLVTAPNPETTVAADSKVTELLSKFSDVFAEPQGLPPTRGTEHQIVLKPGSILKHQYPYRTSHDHKDEIEKIVQKLLDTGIIQPSKSPFASPVILVKKKDGTWRMCVDYRYLNELTVKHDYPIPIIDELLDELSGSKFFSKIDLRFGYFQILMKPEHRYLTAFRTHNGHYEFLVMPFGLCNAPATFQSLMNLVFKDCLRKFTLVFFDDILIYSSTMEDHLIHLKKVLTILRENSLYAKMSKCQFGRTSIEYLGHIISHEGVSTDPQKIESMEN